MTLAQGLMRKASAGPGVSDPEGLKETSLIHRQARPPRETQLTPLPATRPGTNDSRSDGGICLRVHRAGRGSAARRPHLGIGVPILEDIAS